MEKELYINLVKDRMKPVLIDDFGAHVQRMQCITATTAKTKLKIATFLLL